MKIAVIGATGLVGSKMISEILRLNLPYDELILAASERSVGKKVTVGDDEIKVISLQEAMELGPEIALFSAGGAVSQEWAPKYAEAGIRVIDNSSQWRMHKDYKLIVPEINGDLLTTDDYIIANPNCSTIQMVMALQPLHEQWGISRIVVSSYQSVSGSGQSGVTQLMDERQGKTPENPCYPYPIDLNVIPQIDVFGDDDYTKEERKMMNETCKIFGDDSIKVTATTVRVPVMGGHSLSVNATLNQDFNIEEIKNAIAAQEGVVLEDEPSELKFPMPLEHQGDPNVYVGRVREDISMPNSLNMWVVADNLLKGAATNAVQIAARVLDLIIAEKSEA